MIRYNKDVIGTPIRSNQRTLNTSLGYSYIPNNIYYRSEKMEYTVMINKKRDEVTVKLERELYNKFQDTVEEKHMDVKNTIARMAENYTEREKLFEFFEAYMSLVNVVDNSMFIKDIKKDITAEIKLEYLDHKDDAVKLHCKACKTDYCPHVAFALASDELGQLHLNLKKTKVK